MTELNVIYADLSIHNRATTKPLWQWNKGQQLILTGRDLPEAYQVHFSNDPDFGISTTQIGGSSGVAIPDELLMSGRYVYAWLYLTDENSGQTKCYITIPVARRPKPYTYDPTPAQEDAIAETLNALNTGVARVTQLAEQVEVLKTEVEEDAALADNYSHDSEAWAVGQRNGADVDSSDVTYHNNSKYYSDQVSGSLPAIQAAIDAVDDRIDGLNLSYYEETNPITHQRTDIGISLTKDGQYTDVAIWGTNSTIPEATTSKNGWMSATDKTDLTNAKANVTDLQGRVTTLESEMDTAQEDLSDLLSALRSGLEADAEWHLGFYLDENGDLCQAEEGE